MITHRIFTHKKPKLALPVKPHDVHNIATLPVVVQPSPEWRGKQQEPCFIRSQEAFDAYLKYCPMTQDMFVVSTWKDKLGVAEHVDSKTGIHYVLWTQSNFNRLSWMNDKGHPRCFYIVTLFGSTPTPFTRWDSCVDYRTLTDKEFEDVIKPNHDFVQDCIKRWRETYKSAIA